MQLIHEMENMSFVIKNLISEATKRQKRDERGKLKK